MTGRRTPPAAAWWLGMLDVCLCARVCVRVRGGENEAVGARDQLTKGLTDLLESLDFSL